MGVPSLGECRRVSRVWGGFKLVVLLVLSCWSYVVSITLADGWPTEPSRQSGRRVWSGSLGSALEPQAKVSRLLPGAPWPGLGARGFRCAAAGGDALLLESSCRFSTTQLQVGLTPFSPALRRSLHLREPAVRYWGLDPDQRSSARPPLEPAGGRGQGRRLARPALLPRSPGWGGVTLQISPSAHLEFERARLPGWLGFPSSPGLGWLLRDREADPFTPGRG